MTSGVVTQQPVEAYKAALCHPSVFLHNFGYLTDPNDPSLGTFPFHLWPWQAQLLDLFLHEQRLIILKARQLGVSWLLAGYALWLFLTQPGSNILLISKREAEAGELLRKAVFIYRRLPPEFRFSDHKRDIDSNSRFHSVHLGSNIVALPATPDAARSWTATCVMPDEWALQEYAAEMFAGYEPTLGSRGQIIGCSTAQGPSGFFYNVWESAKRRENGFLPVFLPWNYRPGRTPEWREEQRRRFTSQGNPEILEQEYPADELDAFGGSINLFFPAEVTRSFLAGVKPPVEARMDGDFRIYKQPRFAGKYVIGADVAEGLAGGDYSTATILDTVTGEWAASLRCRVAPDLFGQRLAEVGDYYHNALIGVERNNHGILTINTLARALHYPNLWRPVKPSVRSVHLAAVQEPGWLTTSKSKPEMLLSLRQAAADGSFVSPCSWFVGEMPYFRQTRPSPTKVEYSAASGANDDMIMAAGIAWAIRPQGGAGVRGVRKTQRLHR